MRDFINSILDFIGSSSLTDEEFLEFTGIDYGYNTETYNAIKMLLIERDETTGTMERLRLYFEAKGVQVEAPTEKEIAKSNIFIGSAL